MTVSNQTSVVQYNGNGSTVAWPTGFRFFKNTDLVVTKRSAAGVTTLLTLNTDYSVSGANAIGGGTVTTTSPLLGGSTPELLTIARVLTVQQLTDLRNQGDYFAEIHEDVFDYLTMLIQQVNEGDSRALKHPRDYEHYQAEARRIENLEDPVNGQDAATMNWSRTYLASFISQIQGPPNNSANVFYLGPDGLNYVVQDLSSSSIPAKGAALIGYKGRTVAARLNDFPSVKDYGCKGDGVTNDRANFQAALTANAGGVLYVPPGVYMLDTALFIPSNTKLCGAGSASRLKAMAAFTQLNVAWAGGTLPILLANEGILTSAAATRIEISDLYCDSSLASSGVHNVHMRNTTYCSVHHCTFNGGADGTAFTLSTDYQVTSNFAFGQTNCCYDQWENTARGLVANNVGFLTTGYGMLLTGDTSLNGIGQSANVSFLNNIIIGSGTNNASIGLWLQSGSNLTSQCYSCRAEGNYFAGFRVGIRATGGGQHSIIGNRIENCPEQALSFSAEVAGNPTGSNSVGGNVCNNSGNLAGGGAIVLNSGAKLNIFYGNVISAVTSDYAVILDATTVDNNFMGGNIFSTGNLGFVADLGTRNLCANVSSGFYEEGTFTPTLASSAGGVPTYSAQYGNYQIIGKYCYVSGRVAINSLGTLVAGQIQVANLPKTANASNVNNQPPVAASFNNCAAALAVPPNGRIPSGTTRIDLSKFVSGSNAPLVLADITATLEISFQSRYRTA